MCACLQKINLTRTHASKNISQAFHGASGNGVECAKSWQIQYKTSLPLDDSTIDLRSPQSAQSLSLDFVALISGHRAWLCFPLQRRLMPVPSVQRNKDIHLAIIWPSPFSPKIGCKIAGVQWETPPALLYKGRKQARESAECV